MSRPDLPWLREAVGLGSVFDARRRADASRPRAGRARPSTAARCSRPIATLATGTTVRVRIPAREVILATREPEGLSLHNVLSGTVSAIHADPGFDTVIVQIAVGGVLLLAEVTRDAIERLGIGVG